jgi:hypothetical protein
MKTEELVFKPDCKENMKRYIRFLHYHHGYSIKRLKETFTDYIKKEEEVKNEQIT